METIKNVEYVNQPTLPTAHPYVAETALKEVIIDLATQSTTTLVEAALANLWDYTRSYHLFRRSK